MRLPGSSTSSAAIGAEPRPHAGIAAKICGLKTVAGVRAAVAGGADYLGFVFYPPSPRAVSPARAGRLCAAIPAGAVCVGLFVDADDATIAEVLDAAPIEILQFHGGESPARVEQARARFGRQVIKAVPVGGLVIARIAPLLGLEPRFELPPSDKLILASAGESR